MDGGGIIVVHWNDAFQGSLKGVLFVMVGVVFYRFGFTSMKNHCFFIPCYTGHDYRTFGSKFISLKLASTIN